METNRNIPPRSLKALIARVLRQVIAGGTAEKPGRVDRATAVAVYGKLRRTSKEVRRHTLQLVKSVASRGELPEKHAHRIARVLLGRPVAERNLSDERLRLEEEYSHQRRRHEVDAELADILTDEKKVARYVEELTQRRDSLLDKRFHWLMYLSQIQQAVDSYRRELAELEALKPQLADTVVAYDQEINRIKNEVRADSRLTESELEAKLYRIAELQLMKSHYRPLVDIFKKKKAVTKSIAYWLEQDVRLAIEHLGRLDSDGRGLTVDLFYQGVHPPTAKRTNVMREAYTAISRRYLDAAYDESDPELAKHLLSLADEWGRKGESRGER